MMTTQTTAGKSASVATKLFGIAGSVHDKNAAKNQPHHQCAAHTEEEIRQFNTPLSCLYQTAPEQKRNTY
jgi:hypothetical protein